MNTNLINRIDSFRERPFMVIGDMVADVYLEGKISRISREAPVLVLEHAGEKVVPGGAANVVHNAVTLGAQVYAVGLVGGDSAGKKLTEMLRGKGVHVAGLISSNERPTITKTRVMAGGHATVRQQVVRIDREAKEPVPREFAEALLAYIRENIANMEAVILSDYGSGTVTSQIREFVIQRCREEKIPCIVDSRYNIMDYQGIEIVKQNESEAAAALGYKTLDEKNLHKAGQEMLHKLAAEAVLISRGPAGMTLFEKNGTAIDIPVTNKSEVYDVTGAGDTVVVAFMLARAAGASYLQAARISNFAAGVVVRKPGTATTTTDEIKAAIGAYDEDSI